MVRTLRYISAFQNILFLEDDIHMNFYIEDNVDIDGYELLNGDCQDNDCPNQHISSSHNDTDTGVIVDITKKSNNKNQKSTIKTISSSKVNENGNIEIKQISNDLDGTNDDSNSMKLRNRKKRILNRNVNPNGN